MYEVSIDRSTPFRHSVDASGQRYNTQYKFHLGFIASALTSPRECNRYPIESRHKYKGCHETEGLSPSPPTYALRFCTCYLLPAIPLTSIIAILREKIKRELLDSRPFTKIRRYRDFQFSHKFNGQLVKIQKRIFCNFDLQTKSWKLFPKKSISWNYMRNNFEIVRIHIIDNVRGERIAMHATANHLFSIVERMIVIDVNKINGPRYPDLNRARNNRSREFLIADKKG